MPLDRGGPTMARLKIATFNVNGIKTACRTCSSGSSASSPTSPACRSSRPTDTAFPREGARATPATARSGTASGRGTASRSWRAAPTGRESGAGCRATPSDTQSRYLEAAVDGVIVALPLPAERQPAAGPEVRLQARLVRAADRARGDAARDAASRSCSPATTTSCRPTSTSTTRRSWRKDALLQPESRELLRSACSRRAGPMRSARCIRTSAIYTFWDYFRKHWERNAGLRIDHLLLERDARAAARATPASTAGCAGGRGRATTRRRGSCSTMREEGRRRASVRRRARSPNAHLPGVRRRKCRTMRRERAASSPRCTVIRSSTRRSRRHPASWHRWSGARPCNRAAAA